MVLVTIMAVLVRMTYPARLVDAWHQSEQIAVGFPLVRVSDIESRAAPMTTTTLGAD